MDNKKLSVNNLELLEQAEAIILMLEYCSVKPGASINITIQHTSGITATAELYDHATLVNGLWRTLYDFRQDIEG